MKRSEQIAFCMNKLQVSDSMLAAIILVTEKALHSEEAKLAHKRLGRMVKIIQMAEKAKLPQSSLMNLLDQPINRSQLDDEDQDCSSCASYYITDDEAPEATVDLAFTSAIEIFQREIKIQDLEEEIKTMQTRLVEWSSR